MKPRVLLTGSAGRIGRAAALAFTEAGVPVVGFDRRPTPGLPAGSSGVGDLGDAELLLKLARDSDVIVHLAAAPDDAAYPRPAPPDDRDNFVAELVPANVLGSYHVMEAARKAGVKRVILASSVQVVDELITPDAPTISVGVLPQPRYLYACTKVFLESLGQVYAKDHGLDVLAIRLGWCPRDAAQEAELAGLPYLHDLYLSPADAGGVVLAAATVAPVLSRYRVVYATSQPVRRDLFDLGPAERELGWRPVDRYPAGL